MSKDDRNLRKSRFGCYFICSLVNFKIFIILFFEHMGYLWFVKKFKMCCFDSEHIKKQFIICDPKSLNSIPAM